MIRILLHKHFVKKYKKLKLAERKKFKERRNIFIVNPFHPLLQNHPLRGVYNGYRSISITGDVRVVYKQLDVNTAVFVEVGTHSELYS